MVTYIVLFSRFPVDSDLRMRFSMPAEEDVEYWCIEYARITLPGWKFVGWLKQ